ncbi:hypothetical protein Tco_0699859 [Tanacetum coccineum]
MMMGTKSDIEKFDGKNDFALWQVSNNDTAVAQRWLEDKQPEEKTNTDCLVKEQEKEYQTGWKIKTGIQQQNGLVNKKNVTLFAKVCCFLIQSGLSKVFRVEDTTMSTYLVTRSPLSVTGFKTPIDMLGFFGWLASIKQEMLEPVKVKCIFMGYRKRNMGFNESGEYKKTFIGSGVGTSSMQVLQGDEFEGATLCMGTIQYREDSNKAAFAVAAVDKIYAHKSLTFNNTVACEVISKWKARLKDDIDARSDVIHNEKLVQTLLKGHSILSLEGSLSKDCDVENNGKWSCIYAVGSQEYQMVCTRLDIASADVGMLDKFDRGLQTDVQVFVDFDYAMAAYMTLTGAWKKEIWLKGLLAESGYELSLVAGIATGALVKGGSRSEVPAQVEGAAYRVIESYKWYQSSGSRQQKFLVLRFFDVKDQQGIDRIHNEKLVQTLLKGHSILSLEGSLSGDYDVEKNGKWSCIYAVGSQEYQMVCTRLDIASADVGMLDKFDRGLQTDVEIFVDFDYAMAAHMTLTGAWKKEIWLKGLLAELGYELSLVAVIATGALVKGGSQS